MNFSNNFKKSFEDFYSASNLSNWRPDFFLPVLAEDKIFAYLTPRAGVSPIKHLDDFNHYVLPVYWSFTSPEPEVKTIRKAEDIFLLGGRDLGINTYVLNGNIYYASTGAIFNKNREPIAIMCQMKSEGTPHNILCFDYSVIEDPEEPMNRFLNRKLIPYILERRRTGSSRFPYMFFNCKSFIVKPTFQGELDEKLVEEFLIGKLDAEYNLRHAPDSQRTA